MIKKLFKCVNLFVILLFIFLFGCTNNQAQQQDKEVVVSTEKGSTSSTVLDSTFIFSTTDLKGETQNSSQWVGKQPVVINFWGTWCPPCRLEIPELVKLYPEYKEKGIEIIGIAVPRREQLADIEKFTNQQNMTWPMLIVTNELAIKFKVQSIPTTIFIDKNGKEIDRFVGFREHELLKKAFDSIL